MVAMGETDDGIDDATTPILTSAVPISGYGGAAAASSSFTAPVVVVDAIPAAAAATTQQPQHQRQQNQQYHRQQEEEEINLVGFDLPRPGVVVDDDDVDSQQREDSPSWSFAFRDAPCGVAFLIHLSIFVWLGASVAPSGYDELCLNMTSIEDELRGDDNNGMTEEDLDNLVEFVGYAMDYVKVYPARILLYQYLPCMVLTFVIAYVATTFFLRPCAHVLMYLGLLCTAIVAYVFLAWWCLFVITPNAIGFGMFVFLGIVFAKFVRSAWRMVPFAAVNLKVALEGVGRNCGLYVIAALQLVLGFVWVVFWLYTVVGLLIVQLKSCAEEMGDEAEHACSPNLLIILGSLLSFYWTSAVNSNSLQVTVAGVFATWCFDARDAECWCSSAVFHSLWRTTTTSFGSVCLGSLVEAFVYVLRVLVSSATDGHGSGRNDRGFGSLVGSVLECLGCFLGPVEDVVEYANQWAYVYAGIYGRGYLESGKRVYGLFRSRGWTAIVTDSTVGYALHFTTLFVAVLSGVTGSKVERFVTGKWLDPATTPDASYAFGPLPNPNAWAFWSAFVIGLYLSSVMMNVVKGAVYTLIVCWAESPAALESQHPTLMREMIDAWEEIFPDVGIRRHSSDDAPREGASSPSAVPAAQPVVLV